MKLTSNNQQFTVRATGDSMLPTIQDGDILLVDPRVPPENKAIVVARIKNEIVCRRFVITDGRTLLVPDNHCPDNEIITSDQRIVEVGEEVEILGQLERWADRGRRDFGQSGWAIQVICTARRCV